MANKNPPWSAYQSFMSSCLIELNKLPGLHLVGIGEMWRHIFSKYVIKVTGSEATHTCRDDHICPGFKAGIDRELHRVQYIWESNLTEEKWIFLLVDAKNKFNEINRIAMLWTVRHLWPSARWPWARW